jgi:NCAIR mutase (PurE)-related protein
MDEGHLVGLLTAVREGRLSVEAAVESLRSLPYEDLGFATLDTHRALRQGFPEVLFCPGKDLDQIRAIAARLLARPQPFLATRATPEIHAAIRALDPRATFQAAARAVVVDPDPGRERVGRLLVLAAGTADIPVAEEAAVTADLMGSRVERLFDVGVAGLHRLLDRRARLEAARVIVVVAGMDGVLPSVVGGLVACPVIAVPTSVGYGAAFGGLAPLLTMLNSCAAGVAVVNIDNGFGAGTLAHRINLLAEKRE